MINDTETPTPSHWLKSIADGRLFYFRPTTRDSLSSWILIRLQSTRNDLAAA